MWFKNLVLYRLTKPFELSPEQLAEAVATDAAHPCGGHEAFAFGWTPPLGSAGTELTHAANGYILLRCSKEERILPAAVVRETVDQRIEQIETHEGRKVRAKERERLRDEVTFDLLPRAFTKQTHTYAYIAPKDGWIVVNAATVRRAEDLVMLLGRAVEGLGAEPFVSQVAPQSEMTRWLAGAPLPSALSVQHDCELRDPADEGAIVRCQRQDLGGEEIRVHLKARKQVHKLALGFEERLSFQLHADLTIKRLRFDNVEEFDDLDQPDEVARFDANFAYMTTELTRLIDRLDDIFGQAG